MSRGRWPRAARWLAAGVGLAAGAYGASAGVTWYRYGRPRTPRPEEEDLLLDRFMPEYEVVERHHVRVAAPAEIALDAAKEMDLFRLPLVRAIVKGREWILGARADGQARPHGLLAETQAIGWGVLADVPGREIVMGAATKPWEPNPVFRAIPPDAFAAFAEPDYVKIAWTLRADPVGASASVFRSETRVVATDPAARARFRWYWAAFSPGIALIRWSSLAPIRADAERRARRRA